VLPSRRARPWWFDLLWITLMLLMVAVGMTVCLADLDPEALSHGFDTVINLAHQSDAALPDSTLQAAP
jgi:H+/Cl- antiporter ClcA